MHDVIVVGARCAGGPTAMLLARKGWSVLLVDKKHFPCDTLSTHLIHPTGVACLARWGLLEQVVASGCPAIRQWMFDFGSAVLTGRAPPIDGVAEAYAPRRLVLDPILARAAHSSGAELREGVLVRELLMDDDRVVGIRSQAELGPVCTERARVVVGADGARSLVARTVGARSYDERPVVSFAYYAYWANVPIGGAEFYLREGRLVFAFPTNDGLVCTYLARPRDEFDAFRSDVEGHFLDTLDLFPSLAARVRHGQRVGKFAGTAYLPNFFRKPGGTGWALVGDAGHHKDPAGGFGISDAFRDAELLSDALDAGLSGRRPMSDSLADYERARNEAALPAYDFNYRLASMKAPNAVSRALYDALSKNQKEADQFVGAVMGTLPLAGFFAPGNVGRIIQGVD